MAENEIQWVEIGDRAIPAYKAICPQCKTLDMDTEYVMDGDGKTMYAKCSVGHRWTANLEAE